MLILAATTDKFDMVTDSAATVDVVAAFMDYNGTTVTPGNKGTAFSSATTSDIVSAPGSSVFRNLKELSIRNKDASTSVNVTVRYNANGTIYELHKVTLAPGERLSYEEGVGWFYYTTGYVQSELFNTSDISCPAATTTYILGIPIATASRPIKIGTVFEWDLFLTKTGAGTASSSFDVRFGTAGTGADTSRLTAATGTETAVSDTMHLIVRAIVRGPISSSCIVAGGFEMAHTLAATGFGPTGNIIVQNTSSAFDITTAAMIAGLSVTTGASDAFTVQVASARIKNI